ncbi:hypothetical protein F511_47672 [Dorcoceras hygrometricum]|uniref:Uncharacterized protein n=1 Tax=Dorcoceras hygrometricum TaxID=472368 RepID=A0A2Z6ZWV8_9LAMI|nr:hypothetical protein F511_47672 [Dorcoceras hygrometricum]
MKWLISHTSKGRRVIRRWYMMALSGKCRIIMLGKSLKRDPTSPCGGFLPAVLQRRPIEEWAGVSC